MGDLAQDLVRVVRDLSFARRLDAVTDIVARAARRMTGADGATFILRRGEDCYYADEEAISPLWKGRRFPMTDCISGWVMLNRQPAVIPDIYADPRIPAEAYRPTFVRSLAVVPVRASDPIAAIGAYWAVVRDATKEELATLQTLADAAALAVSNVELYDGLRLALSKAEAAARLRDDFLMLLSHELRTPLMPLVGWAAVLEDNPGDAQAVARAARAISRNARFELALVDQLLDVSQMLSGNVQIEKARVDLVELTREACETVGAAAGDKALQLDAELPPGPCWVDADADRLRQALGHLVSNAVKFTPSGGRITVRLVSHGGVAEIEVADTGIGIEPQSLEAIFERFRRVDASTSREHSGLGLGLALARHIVEQHGGSIAARSLGKGRGSTFTLRLSQCDPEAVSDDVESAVRLRARKR